MRKILAPSIIALAVILSISSSWNDSVTVDEVPHIGAGYSYLTARDYRLNPEHPPLVKDLAAIPLLFQKIGKEKLFSTRFWTDDINGQWEFGRFLIFNASKDAQTTTRMARLPVLIFYILSAIFIFKWTRKLYGKFAGFTALVIFVFSPTIIAHARLVTTDMAALFGVLISTYFFLRYLKSPVKKNFWMAGVFFGLALLTKFSVFLLAPYFLILAIIYGLIAGKKIYSTFLIMIVGFILIVWPVYYFHTRNYPPERQKKDTVYLLGSFGKRNLVEPVIWASDKPVLRSAAEYGLGLLMVTQRQAGGNTAYFWGEVSNRAWKKYFPVVYFIKEPLAWWALVLVAVTAISTRFKSPKSPVGLGPLLGLKVSKITYWARNNFTEFAMLLWLVFYWALSIKGNLNIGVRHLLPTYPFAIILVSGRLSRLLQMANGKWQMGLIKLNLRFALCALLFALFGWYIFENLRVWPHYLTYFNQVAGGPSGGHKIVVDSNLDWGQDLKRFSDWVKEMGIEKIDLDYFGWADANWYLGDKFIWINSRTYRDIDDFKQKNTTGGWIAVSATYLMGSRGGENGDYGWLRREKPLTIIGNSIFVYRLR